MNLKIILIYFLFIFQMLHLKHHLNKLALSLASLK